MALSSQDIDKLETLLFADELHDEALDYFGLHGLVCASLVGPSKIDNEAIKTITFSGIKPKASDEQLKHFDYCIQYIKDEVQECLSEGTEPELPYESEDDPEACQESWCIGFIEGFFLNEDNWFSKDEESAAELLLPIMTLSGLFESEEFEQIRSNDKLMSQFESIIADQLTDIYLFFHTD